MLYNYGDKRKWDGAASTARPVALSDWAAKMQQKSIPQLSPEQLDKFWYRVEVHQPSGCWQWRGTIERWGYGQFSLGKKAGKFRAHRVAYSVLIGPVPDGMQLDHLCRNNGCVNPDHLQVTTGRINTLRGYGTSGMNARKTHCKRGHELSGDNIYQYGNRRSCKLCKTVTSRAAYSRRKEAA